jgi:hypothetical protein
MQHEPGRDDRPRLDGPNSDPTGGSPPKAGSLTRVSPDGRGVTQGPIPARGGDPEPSISNGQNARSRSESISSTARGLPNDASTPLALDKAEELAIERKIREL